MKFPYIFILFVVMPLTELMLLLRVNEIIGFGATLALVVLTATVGASLARFQGVQVFLDVQRDMAQGRMPAPRLVDGVMILFAAAMLVTPGLITDAVGFLLLTPAFRRLLKGWLRGWMENRIRMGSVRVMHFDAQ